jgi:hypothetical protein
MMLILRYLLEVRGSSPNFTPPLGFYTSKSVLRRTSSVANHDRYPFDKGRVCGVCSQLHLAPQPEHDVLAVNMKCRFAQSVSQSVNDLCVSL